MIYGNKFYNHGVINEATDFKIPTSVKFFGDTYNLSFKKQKEITNDDFNKINNIVKNIGTNNTIWNKVASELTGRYIEFEHLTGKDVIKAIKDTELNKKRGFLLVLTDESDIHFCGEYDDIDHEHGFSVQFIGGKLNNINVGSYSAYIGG